MYSYSWLQSNMEIHLYRHDCTLLANDDNTITSCQDTIACGQSLSGYENLSLYTTADSSPLATLNTCSSCFWSLSHAVSICTCPWYNCHWDGSDVVLMITTPKTTLFGVCTCLPFLGVHNPLLIHSLVLWHKCNGMGTLHKGVQVTLPCVRHEVTTTDTDMVAKSFSLTWVTMPWVVWNVSLHVGMRVTRQPHVQHQDHTTDVINVYFTLDTYHKIR